jgi:hypothetical protein
MVRLSAALVAGIVSATPLVGLARQGGAPPPPPPAQQGAAAAPAPTGRGPAPLQNPNPHYASIVMTLDVNAPADKVWARVGKYCDIGEWGGFGGCTILSGKDGELGAVRSIGNEILVAKTDRSYTYTQPVRATGIYNMYHGTLEAKALTPTTSQIVYSLFFDNSQMADDTARENDINNRRTRFTGFLQNMKTLAEGGTLPGRGKGGARH